ncbi:MAG: pilus assembly PilX N-terminal domain-containing protein [Candidatus Schekmanbacteria bacterium]|nr:pilus assembly PilX N-terminal domain-containing protein [Candidatus Schekmanbacteria bacterium]
MKKLSSIFARLCDERGVALLMTLIVMLVVFVGGMALTLASITDRKMVTADQSYQHALDAAESGVAAAVSYLNSLAVPIASTSPLILKSGAADSAITEGAFNTCCGGYSVGDAWFDLVIDPRDNNSGSATRLYLIRSTGYARGQDGNQVTRQVEIVAQQINFARYAYFEDTYLNGTYWPPESVFQGPYHTNAHLVIYADNSGPNFFEEVTQHEADVVYLYGSGAIGAQFHKGITVNFPVIELPSNTTKLVNAASGGIRLTGSTWIDFFTVHDTTDPSAIPAGYALIGNANLAANAPAGSVIGSAFCSGGGGNVGANMAVVKLTDRYDYLNAAAGIQSGGANGVISLTGAGNTANFSLCRQYQGVLWPQIATALAVPQAHLQWGLTGSNTVSIDGQGWIYDDTRYYYYGGNPQGILGIVASNNLSIKSNTRNGLGGGAGCSAQPADSATCHVQVDGTVMTLNKSYQGENYNKNGLRGTMYLFGGTIQEQGGLFGVGDGSGNSIHGWSESYTYDNRLMNTPPPYYPTTGVYTFLDRRERSVAIPTTTLADTPNTF